MLAKDSKKAQKVKEKLVKQYNLQVCIYTMSYIYVYIIYMLLCTIVQDPSVHAIYVQ